MDELALNVYRRKENAAALVLKFLKAGCQNIHLNILKADCVKRNKCASLGTYFEISIHLTSLSKLRVEAFTAKQIQTAFQ